MRFRITVGIVLFCVLTLPCAHAQTAAEVAALKGLAPVSVLPNTDAGKAALEANYTGTGGIQTGKFQQPTLLPFAEQQQQALRDAFITGNNLAQLSDGLGSTLGAAYLARFHYIDAKQTSKMAQPLADLIRYALAVSGSHAGAGKYFFANATTDGKTPVAPDVMAILKNNGGMEDVFGSAYGRKAGTAGADAYGNSRPFQTEHDVTKFSGKDYLNKNSDNFAYNYGPDMDLVNSPSYPSGHTTYGYTGAVLLAVLVPERYAQMIARGAEYGNDRILMGSHYIMDVMGGRTLALYDMAHLLANDPAYVGLSLRKTEPIKDFRAAVKEARAELDPVLQTGCGDTIAACSKEDTGRFNNPQEDAAFCATTQTYNLPVVYAKNAEGQEDVGKLAPEAGYLLTVAFPSLTLEQADKILTETEGPGGRFLDDGSSFGVYSRLNLYAAGLKAAQIAGK
ncbi:phosphatase PAP2 family protein [Acidicapsa dinghuensis]|uniref:Phosphatase PAP2 family protein n=1 Tax=Acidicapsa dinghuensis TaxID=2218256 RepID=A0ABW1EC11_9BACT|nr:phosphatase PAP2 family protein [Acidicapsa dinghuensis]